MPKDFKNRAEAGQEPPKRRGHCLFWFLAGVLSGGFAMGLTWLKYDPALIRSAEVLKDQPVPKVDKTQRPPVANSIEFEFPDLLKEMKVLVYDDPEPAAAPPAAPKPPVKPPPAAAPQVAADRPQPRTSQPKPPPAKPAGEREAYELQIGSFRKESDAERLKAKLGFLGIQTRIQKVTINGNQTFHRVRSGPYRSQTQMDEVRRMLTRNKVQSIVVRWKG